MEELNAISRKIQDYLGMSTRPIGIKLLREDVPPAEVSTAHGFQGRHSFCWYVHEAAGGSDFLVGRENVNCLNADIVLGFREPRFANIEPRIKQKIAAVRIGPLEDADAVALVLNAEQGMTFCNIIEGCQVTFKRNRTVCGESVARVYNDKQPNLSLLCIGARTKGGFHQDELLVSMPHEAFLKLPASLRKFNAFSRHAKDGLAQQLLKIS